MFSVTNKILHCLLSLLFLSRANGAYFSMSNVHMNLPGDKSKYPPTDHPILTLYALKDNEMFEKEVEHYIYSLENSAEQLVQVYRSTGDLMFKRLFFRGDVTNVKIQATVEDSSGMRDSTAIQIDIGPRRPLNCDSVTQDLCFWQSASYRIFENRKPSVLGSLSSPYLTEMCKGYKVNYTITNGGDQFGVLPSTDINKSWEIISLKSLDRDVIRTVELFHRESPKYGEYRYLSVTCTVKAPNGIKREVVKNISIKVLDEDDNPLKTRHTGEYLHIQQHNNMLFEGQVIEHDDLVFIDRDSPPVNEYNIAVTNDRLKILEPNCTIFEDDREGEPQTAISCKLVVKKDVDIFESPYSINLEINDTTLIPGFGESLVKIPIRIYFDKYREFPKAFALTMPPTDIKRPLLLYPFAEVMIFRTAAPLARVTQPNKENLANGINSFWLLKDSSDGAFNITETEGIVFVHNITKLRNQHEVKLTIQWLNNKTKQTDDILVKITNEPNHTCKDRDSSTKDWDFCSAYKNKKDCSKACGLSTGGSASTNRRKTISNPERCMWRGDLNPGDALTQIYSTCTPDTATCPDGICDSLEDLHYLICPQDCTEKIRFPMHRNKKTGRGFDVGVGICSCDRLGDCFCEYAEKKKSKGKGTTTAKNFPFENGTTENTTTPIVLQSDVSRHVSSDLSKCGTKCIVGVTGSALLLIIIIGGMIFCFRLYRRHKGVREKFPNEGADFSVPLSDYIDRNGTSENLHFNFDITTITTTINRTEPDPKWEFPRNQLSIEQTLGEGEFGRVLRARAFNIAGQTGYATVAVKTLKHDAGERELADLLSEYQLLKEVSHPNIIKLLGASTVPGGPVYLIIEFAELGSLRNYLRRSRHLQTDVRITTDRLPNTNPEHYDEPKVCEITPKEILSFAWQIANGMTYLGDIKLVHRDLAARNVLLASGKICKISDFGLTRDIYEDDAYFKRSKGRVPVKWMAPESLSDHVYTNKSDVWSYGILIWELITLGASPYPGIVVQSLFHLLKTGYRMERPENCSVALYKIMRSCWSLEPEKRPTFADLSIKFEKMLEDEVEYLDLTNNAFNNRGYFCNNLEDVEVEIENGVNKTKSGTEALNYLNKTVDIEKCGNSTKISEIMDESRRESLEVEQNNIGYETPVKVQDKIEKLPTPGNEFPQYGYTDMTACQSK